MSLVEQALKKAKLAGPPAPLSTATAPLEPTTQPSGPGVEAIEPSPEITATVKPLKFLRIDPDALRTAGYLPPIEQEREIAEQFRHLKRPLVARALGRGLDRTPLGNRIVVTSAMQGEGKSFTSLNLALSLALERDVRVLLIDCDVARPGVSRVLGIDREPGLIDALNDPAIDPETFLYQTSFDGLTIMSAGTGNATALELLSSPRMDALLQRLIGRDPHAIVLFDAPPLLVTNEAKAICEAAGQVVLVVCANSTPQRAVTDAIAHVAEGKFVGLVLNQSDTVSGVGYGYGYGYYGDMYHYGRGSNGAA